MDAGIVEAGREVLLQPLHGGDVLLRGLERVGIGALEDAERHRLLAVQVAVGDVFAGAELDPRDVLQADEAAVVAGLHDHRAELARVPKASLRADHVLEGIVAGIRRRADGAAGDLPRTEERRGGKEWARTGRTRGTQYN